MSEFILSTMIDDLLGAGSVSPRVSAAGKRQALSVVAEIAARAFSLKAPKVFDALMDRETLSPTGVGHGVAIPHAQVEGLDRMRGVFVRLNEAIDYGAVDDEPVDLIFALLAPPGIGSEQLRVMARVARALRAPDMRRQLRQAGGGGEIRALLVQDVRPSAA